MQKILITQCPKKFSEVLPFFCDAIAEAGIVDKVYVMTDANINLNSLCEVFVEEDHGLIGNLFRLLEHVPEDCFMLALEDHLLVNPSKEDFNSAWDFFTQNPKVGFLRLRCSSNVHFLDQNPFSEFSPSDEYYVSFQPAIWKKEYFAYSFRAEENPWLAEKAAAKRAVQHTFLKSFGSRKIIYNFINCFKAGKYMREEFYNYLKKKGLIIQNPKDIYLLKNNEPTIVSFREYENKRKTTTFTDEYNYMHKTYKIK